MKFTVFLLGILVVLASAVKQELYKLPQEKLLKFAKIANECAHEYNVDPKLITKMVDGTLPRDEATNNYLYCSVLKTGLIYENGHMNIDGLVALIGGDHPLVEEYKEALNKCNEATRENHIATVVEMNRCYTETAPVRLVVS